MKILTFIIALTGILFLKMPGGNSTEIPQAAYFIFSAGILFSMILVKKNYLIGAMFGWVSFIFLWTTLFRNTSKVQAMDCLMTSFALAGIYYFIREFKIKEDILRWFLVPAGINILFIFVQKFCPQIIPLQSKEVSGLLGNAGMTAVYLGMTTPIFLKYFRDGIVPLFLAIMFCDGFVGMGAFLISCIFYNLFKKNSIWIPISIGSFGGMVVYSIQYWEVIQFRLSMWLGTLDGIARHPFLGWGVGSFIETMKKIPKSDSIYLGVPFNTENAFMNHPANEFLFGWWNFGLPFLFLMILLTIYVFKNFKLSTSFLVLLAGFVSMMGFMLKPPMLFLMVLAFGIFENQREEKNNEKYENTNAKIGLQQA